MWGIYTKLRTSMKDDAGTSKAPRMHEGKIRMPIMHLGLGYAPTIGNEYRDARVRVRVRIRDTGWVRGGGLLPTTSHSIFYVFSHCQP